MLRPYGFEMSQEVYSSQFAGKVEEDTLTIVREEYGITLPDDFLSRLRLEIERHLDHDLLPITGMKEVIQSLTLPKAIVSNSRLVRVIASLKTAGLAGLFGEEIFAAEMVDHPKPAPDVYLHAAKTLGVAPDQCLVVEDSQSGVTAAHRAGMTVIGFLGASHIPAGHGEIVKQAGAWATAANAEELKNIFSEVLQ